MANVVDYVYDENIISSVTGWNYGTNWPVVYVYYNSVKAYVGEAPFILLENIDRLVKSPDKQRGHDFGIILACLRDLGYTAEWRIINAADYGFQQRRRRTFIYAYRNDTKYAQRLNDAVKYNGLMGEEMHRHNMAKLLGVEGFFAKSFPVSDVDPKTIKMIELPLGIGDLSDSFRFIFENTGVMKDGIIYVKCDCDDIEIVKGSSKAYHEKHRQLIRAYVERYLQY